ncbi:MAG TPA: methyltransferase, partial [Mycobacterium sp.]|nr:methyltransferase [Mycobacterium sp.]
MTTTLQDPRVAAALEGMYREANAQSGILRERQGELTQLASLSAQERADALSDIYMPVTPEAGRLLYALVRA